MISLDQVKVTPPRSASLELARAGLQQQGNCRPAQHKPAHGQAAPAHPVLGAGIREGRKRVKLAIAIFTKEEAQS
jgi:hypothetical protein